MRALLARQARVCSTRRVPQLAGVTLEDQRRPTLAGRSRGSVSSVVAGITCGVEPSGRGGYVWPVRDCIASYDRDRLASLTADRRRAALRVLIGFAERIDGSRSLRAEDVRAFLDTNLTDGYSAGTLRKHLAMLRTFFECGYRHGHVDAQTLLAVRAVRPPVGSVARAQPQPYRPGDLRELQRVLDDRWPRLPDDEARRRTRDGRMAALRTRASALMQSAASSTQSSP
jgi:hypothetical protein